MRAASRNNVPENSVSVFMAIFRPFLYAPPHPRQHHPPPKPPTPPRTAGGPPPPKTPPPQGPAPASDPKGGLVGGTKSPSRAWGVSYGGRSPPYEPASAGEERL